MSLHSFGLVGVQKPSYYEAHGAAFHEASSHFDLKSHLLANAPNLSMLLASDPENHGQAIAKDELMGVLETAMKLKGWQ